MAVTLHQLLKTLVEQGGTDLHVTTNSPPQIRVDGNLVPLQLPPLTAPETKALAYSVLTDQQKHRFEENLELDFSFGVRGLARFRANVFSQRGAVAAAFRTIPWEVKNFQDLGLPDVVASLCEKPRGLVLVTGPTGSGKSTTLAGMVNHCNDNRPDHIITIEDPIEFVHESKRCLVNQREVHRDTLGFSEALRSALREDPDVVLVGEMRDLETIRLALTAAETGHLVFGTLHTSSAAKTIDRIVDVFPAGEKEMVRAMMSESLRAVISQTLMKRVGGGRIAAHEIMIGTPAIRNLIREGKIAQMYSAIQTGQGQGMQTLDQCLEELVQKGVVSREEAKYKAQNKDSI
jgi:twitching motility protein PilT